MERDDEKFPPRETFPAPEVAQDILEHGCRNFDYCDWKTLDDADKAKAWDDLIATFAALEFDKNFPLVENWADNYSQIKDALYQTLVFWAQREIRNNSRNGLEKS